MRSILDIIISIEDRVIEYHLLFLDWLEDKKIQRLQKIKAECDAHYLQMLKEEWNSP